MTEPRDAGGGAVSSTVDSFTEPIGSGRLGDAETKRWVAIGTAATVGLFWLLGTLGHPFRLFDDPRAVTSNFFDIQARRLLSGHLSVPAGSLLVEEFVTPRGSHMYFGILPALLRLPLLALDTGLAGRLTLFSCLCAIVVACLSSARLARRAQSIFAHRVDGTPIGSPRWFALFAAAPVAFSPALFLASRSFVYNEAIMWGVATSLWAIDAILQWWYVGRRSDEWRLAAALIAAVNTRPSTSALPILAVLALLVVLAIRRRWMDAAVGASATALAVTTYSIVNYARFAQLAGAPHDLQVSYIGNSIQQAAVEATGGSLFSLRFVPTSAWSYLVPFNGEISLTRLFPFIRLDDAPRGFLSAPMQLTPTGSIPTGAPALFVLALLGAWVLIRRGDAAWRTLVVAGCIGSFATLGFWSVWQRYLADFVPLLVTLAAVGVWGLANRLRRSTERQRRWGVRALVVTLALGLLAQTDLTLWGRFFYLSPDFDEQVSAIEFRLRLDRVLFESPSPDVIRVAPGTPAFAVPAAEAQQVLVAGQCDAIYVLNWGWRAIERRSGGGHRAVVGASPELRTSLLTTASVVAGGPDWTLRTAPGAVAGEVALEYVNPAGVTTTGVLDMTADPLALDVVADPITGQLQVSQGGRMVIDLAGESPSGLTVGPEWAVVPSTSTVCTRMIDGR